MKYFWSFDPAAQIRVPIISGGKPHALCGIIVRARPAVAAGERFAVCFSF